MCRLIESIKVKNHQFENLLWHQERLNKARFDLLESEDEISLSKEIDIPANIDKGIYKCRIIYDNIIRSIEFTPYNYEKIQSIQLVYDDDIEYSYKFENRKKIHELYAQKEDCDDILIIRNGYATDTLYGNIVFYDGDDWITPHIPLLMGTKRAKLLSERKIKEGPVYWDDIKCFKKVSVINAFLDLNNKYTTFQIKNVKI